MKIVKVEWIDAATYDDEGYEVTDKFSTCPSVSVGYLQEETEDKIVLARDLYEEDDGRTTIRRILAIPKAWIKKITDLEEK